jgi:uncharacterized coiled-coil protein SlyX
MSEVIEVSHGEDAIQALILAVKQLSENVARMDRGMEAMNEKMSDVRDRLTHLEAQSYGEKISDLYKQIDILHAEIVVLQADKNKRDGVADNLEWLSKVGGWFTAIVMGAAALWATLKNGVHHG